MTRLPALLAAALAGLALASPAFALSVTSTSPGSAPGAKLTDPDEALSSLFKHFAGSGEPTARETPRLHGAPVVYDLSQAARSAKQRDGLAELSAHPGDSKFNPFMGGDPATDGPSARSR